MEERIMFLHVASLKSQVFRIYDDPPTRTLESKRTEYLQAHQIPVRSISK